MYCWQTRLTNTCLFVVNWHCASFFFTGMFTLERTGMEPHGSGPMAVLRHSMTGRVPRGIPQQASTAPITWGLGRRRVPARNTIPSSVKPKPHVSIPIIVEVKNYLSHKLRFHKH